MSSPVPFETGPIHFVGIGGIGMSGIAEVMLNLGYKVQGSDIKSGPTTERLEKLGAKIFIGHHAENVTGTGALVVSSAIKKGNPEVDEARAKSIPIVRRAEMLAELMRLKWAVAVGGTHGKTTTTSMIAALLEGCGLDPTVINGGIINAYGANAKLGEGKWMVVEADESDGSFTRLFSTVAVVTNMDPEHLDHYGDFDTMKAAYDKFIENLPFYGFAVLCIDHPEVQALVSRITDRRVITYGFNTQADVTAENVRPDAGGSKFDIVFRKRGGDVIRWSDMYLPMAGRHNVQNAMAALAVCEALGGREKDARTGLKAFGGVKRRFTQTGTFNGARIIDDYGHHPVEISAVLQAAKDVADGKVIAVMQPHRYSRLHDLFDDFCTCFNDAAEVFVADVYAAGEAPIDGVSGEALVKGIRSHGHRSVQMITRENLAKTLAPHIEEGDVVVCLGAGDITAWAYALPKELEAL